MAQIQLKNVTFSYKYFPSIGGGLFKSSSGLKSKVALRHIDLNIEKGDTVALLGTNGAGKSTLLKLISGVFKPEQGVVKTNGKIYSFFGRNVGVMPQLSGYDNLKVRGLLLNLNDKEIAEKIEEIVEFTGLGEDLERPVSTYSQGMRARLTFGMLMFVNAEILLVDEGLAAGDKFFLAKTHKFVNDLLDQSKILIFASHSNELLRRFCKKALWLNNGEVMAFGSFETVLKQYNQFKK